MFLQTFRFLSFTRQSLLQQDSARRLALGVVMGMLMGLLPKDSLFVFAIFVLLMISTANLFSAFVSGIVFNWIGALLDPFFHKLGGIILTADGLEPTWMALYQWPLMSWTRFNNTVVMGTLVVGLALAYPIYRLSYGFFEKHGNILHERIKQTWLYRWVVTSPVTVSAKES